MLSDTEFKNIYSKVPRACVDLILRDPKKGIFLTKRSIEPAKGMWHIPGGTIRYQETLALAVKRIARQELGAEVEVKKILGTTEITFSDYFYHDICTVVEIKPASDNFTLDNQASESAYFQTLPSPMIPAQKAFCKDVLGLQD